MGFKERQCGSFGIGVMLSIRLAREEDKKWKQKEEEEAEKEKKGGFTAILLVDDPINPKSIIELQRQTNKALQK